MTQLGASVRHLRRGRLGRALRIGVAMAGLLGVPFAAGIDALPAAAAIHQHDIADAAIIRVQACWGEDCGGSPGPREPRREPFDVCRQEESYDGSWGRPHGPEDCGIRCMYERMRHGYCGPGCDYYVYRMDEYRDGNIDRRRRCRR